MSTVVGPDITVMPDADTILRKIFLPAARRDPYPWLAQLQQRFPVHRTSTGMYIFSRYDDVATIATDPVFQVKDPAWFDEHASTWREHPGMRLFLSSMVFRNGAEHQWLRSTMTTAFAPARLRRLAEVTRAAGEQHLEALPGSLDLHTGFTLPVVQETVSALIGCPPDDGPYLYDLIQPLLVLLDPLFNERAVERADRAAATLQPYLDDLIATRRRHGREDLASGVTSLNDEDAAAALTLALAAGFDTAVTLIDRTISALLPAPDPAATPISLAKPAIPATPDLIDAAVQESLRHDPPLQLITRVTARPTSLSGVELEAGQEVLAFIAAAHRDPSVFDAPDTFDPHRPSRPLLAFGGGAHFCLGGRLAKQSAQIMLPALLERFPDVRRSGQSRSNQRVTLSGWTNLPVILSA